MRQLVQTTLILLLVLSAGVLPALAAAPLPVSAPSRTPSPSPTPVPAVTLALLGDVMLGRSVRPHTETFAYIEPFLQQADIAAANLESPLTTQPYATTSPYKLCADPKNAKFLKSAGFDLFSLANNHRLDCGAAGYTETLTTLQNAGMEGIPIGVKPVFREVNGIKLAFIAIKATGWINKPELLKAISDASAQGALVIVAIHWGTEYKAEASKTQKSLALEMAQAGATLIWGHHPHVLQPTEWIEANGRQTLVLYSLGNALFDQYGIADTRQSALALITFSPTGIRQADYIPFEINERFSKLVEPSDEVKLKILERLKP